MLILYRDLVWLRHGSAVAALSASSSIDNLRDNKEVIQLSIETLNFFNYIPGLKINMYNIYGTKFLSTNNNQVVNLDQGGMNNTINRFVYKQNSLVANLGLAQAGKASSQLITEAKFKLDDKDKEGLVIQTFIPIFVKKDNREEVQCVVEIFTDVTEQWQKLTLFQNVTIAGILIITGLFVFVLRFSSTRAQRLIEKEHEANAILIEEKEKAEAESIEKSKFLANVSHELRTPLNAIIGFSEIIKTETLGPVGVPEYKEYIGDINNSGTHLLSLINDILDYSKAEAEKLQVDAVEVDAIKAMVLSMRLIQPRAEDAKVQLVQDLPKERIILICDPKRLKQALLNLLSNAVKFTPEGGSVTLSAKAEIEEKTFVIMVKDTGIGIAEQDIAKAMATFGQVDSKLSRKYEGTGLGLPLTKKLVELMNGKFVIKSALGFGTTVSISFPYDPLQSLEE